MKVRKTTGVLHVLAGNQNLCDGVVILRKKLIVGIHQLALSHGRRRLLGRDILRPGLQRELADAHADRAGRDEDHFMPRVFQVAQDLAKPLDLAYIQKSICVGKRGRAHLHDDSHKYRSPFCQFSKTAARLRTYHTRYRRAIQHLTAKPDNFFDPA